MTQAPLPTWAHFWRALSGAAKTEIELTAPWRRAGDCAGLLSRTSWSLALIAAWRKRQSPERSVTFWLPAFFCDSSLVVLRRAGARLVFYPVTDSLDPDVTAFGALAADAPPDVVMAVHYFGRPSPLAQLHDFCRRHNAWLVEDAAHVLQPIAGVGSLGDFVLYSPHKLLPIPDGAVLVARENGPGQLGSAGIAALGEPRSWPAQVGNLETALAAVVRSGSARAGNWLIKRVLQKIGIRSGASCPPFVEPLSADPHVDLPQPAVSSLSRRLLGSQLSDLGARERERNQLLWDAVLAGGESPGSVRLLARPSSRAWTPYLAAYTSSSAKKTYREWGSRGCLVTTWPDLPPEVKADQSKYANAWSLRHSRLYLPIHASVTPRAIAQYRRTAPGLPPDPINIRWDAADSEQWHRWLTMAGRSSLLQDWAYGAAKAETSGWRVRRAAFFAGSEAAIAIAQFHERRIAGLVVLRRLNRGPEFLRDVTAAERRGVWSAIAQMGNMWRGQVLSSAPNAPLHGQSLLELISFGFRPAKRAGGWESIWLDLTLPLDELRRRQQKEWRNALSASERAGLTADVSASDDAFDWMMAKYAELMGEKHFSGASIPLLTSLRTHARAGQVVVVRAWRDGSAVAGVLIVRHGDAATYVVGWNGPAGRTAKANHFLLWHAAGYLRDAGVRWFDLGGLSDEHTPGVTAFKLGMGGDRYELVGEFVKW